MDSAPRKEREDARVVGQPRNAWSEGAQFDHGDYLDEIGYDVTRRTLADAVSSYVTDFPVLARAAHRTVEAHDVIIEWHDRVGLAQNHMQILRTLWTDREHATEDRTEEFLWNHLRDIEVSLTHGTPMKVHTVSGLPLRYVGGVLHYLGRLPDEQDELVLRPLGSRELSKRTWLHPGGSRTNEWLSELSLQVSRVPERSGGLAS